METLLNVLYTLFDEQKKDKKCLENFDTLP